ncbi:hypothetical protein, variant [Aphanomyces astaci]|nr:hypothetical protein, variant [Aphanomyces astaci]ETV66865.1 hypothetical protein, variant [Aphanomyces astaci]|eukprot:XP_009843668.1 hypothetical protein, variant [Aphanomyces astaci]
MGYFRRRQAAPSPPQCPDMSMTSLPLDWEALAQWMHDESSATSVAYHDIDCVWTLAHALYEAVDTCPVDVSIFHGLTHASTMPFLAAQQNHGHFYATFTILVTILERALYDLYALLHDGPKSNMILRDLLHSPELERRLPPGYMHVLHVLFLPSGLNIRNLVWHGFLAPFELPPCLNALLFALLADPCLQHPSTSAKLLQQLPSMDSEWTRTALNGFKLSAGIVLPATPTNLHPAIAHVMVVKSRWGLIRHAMAAYTAGQSLMCLFVAIPVLEHILRCEFVSQNAPAVPSGMQSAQLKQYYSTLDGFGQRHQHQVLLARDLFTSNHEVQGSDLLTNRLYETLPRGVLEVCLDLFMAATGPNIRAKLCHGELSLDSLVSSQCLPSTDIITDDSMTSTDICAGLVMAVLLEILYPHEQPATRFQVSLASYDCIFHPYNALKRSLDTIDATLQAWDTLLASFAYTTSPSETVAGHIEWTWTALTSVTTAHPTVQFTDKAHRMIPSQLPTSPWDSKTMQFNSIPDGLVILSGFLQTLSKALATNHCPRSRFLVGQDYSAYREPHGDNLELPRLNLATVHNLPAAACMLAILEACRTLLAKFTARLLALQDFVVHGTARTSHRRSLVNLVLMAPSITRIIRLAAAIV